MWCQSFDALVVVVSWALDVAATSDDAVSGFGLLIVLRLWRITRIMHGVVHSVKRKQAETIATISAALAAAEERADALEMELSRFRMMTATANIDRPSTNTSAAAEGDP